MKDATHAASGALVVPRPLSTEWGLEGPRWGAFAYVVSRNGLKTLLDRFWPGGADGPAFHDLSSGATISLHEYGPNAVSDFVLYEHPEVYYAPRPLLTYHTDDSLLHTADLICQRRSKLAIKRIMYPGEH